MPYRRPASFHPLLLTTLLVGALTRPVSATVVGTIFSGPTTADPMASYWNPAAATLLSGHSALIYSGTTMIGLGYRQRAPSAFDGQPYPEATMFTAKPEIAVGLVSDLGTRDWRVSLAFATPVLDGARWDLSYGGRPSATRYYSIAGQQVHLVFRPSVAYRVNSWLSVGVGVDIVGIWLKSESMVDIGALLNQSLCGVNPAGCALDAPFPREDPRLDAKLAVDDLGWGVGASASVLVTPRPWLRLGLTVSSGARDVDVPVDINVAIPSAVSAYVNRALPSLRLPALSAKSATRTHSPMMVTAGLWIAPTPRLELAADLHWIQKSKMGVMLVEMRKSSTALITDQLMVKRVDDAYTVGLRGSYRLTKTLVAAVRGEFTSNTMPDRYTTPVSLDFNKFHWQVGASWRAASWLEVVFEVGHTLLFPRTIRDSAFAPNANPTTPEEVGLDKPSPEGRYTGFAVNITGALIVGF